MRAALLAPAAAFTLALAGCQSLPVDAPSSVAAFHARLVGAFNTCDEKTFVASYAERFSFATSNTRVAVRTPEGLRRYIGSGCAQSPSPQVTLASQTMQTSGKAVLVSGQYVFRMMVGGRLTDVTQNFTMALEPDGGSWRIVAHHVSLAP